ncbi:MAG: helix-hairpin-helix domain-containing protein, partial [Saprospiraceae bacterium]|nr:helix-hairpin-helix domain-containing protein [Saprospiraceae bacterium]
MSSETVHLLAISRIPKVGPVTARQLISYCGGAEAVFSTPSRKLLKIPGIGPVITRQIRKADLLAEAAADLERCGKAKVKIISFLDPDYPSRLKPYSDSPLVLFYRGRADL